METLTITLPSSGDRVSIQLERKKIKACRLRVYPDQAVILSLPQGAPLDWAENFLLEKSDWIETKLRAFQKTAGYAATAEIRNGYSITMLGEDMVFALAPCGGDHVYAEGKTIHIGTPRIHDQDAVNALFEAWWRRQAQQILEERVRRWHPVIGKYGIEMPKVVIRKMKTLWGSCSVSRHVVTFNFYLIKARMPYIDYVVLHELVHFLYPNHSEYFYTFLSNYMPDWRERKNMLDQNVVHGL